MTGKRPRAMAWEEFLVSDLGHDHFEWVDGEAVEMPAVNDTHDQIVGWLRTVMMLYVEHKQLGQVKGEPFVMRPSPDANGRAPDVCFVAKSRLRRIRYNHLNGPADVAVEVISPKSRRTDSVDKLLEYERGGVREYWLIDPARQAADFYALRRRKYVPMVDASAERPERVFRSEALEGFWIEIDWLWKRPSPLTVAKRWELV
jgi:Uma2 family endonuclease